MKTEMRTLFRREMQLSMKAYVLAVALLVFCGTTETLYADPPYQEYGANWNFPGAGIDVKTSGPQLPNGEWPLYYPGYDALGLWDDNDTIRMRMWRGDIALAKNLPDVFIVGAHGRLYKPQLDFLNSYQYTSHRKFAFAASCNDTSFRGEFHTGIAMAKAWGIPTLAINPDVSGAMSIALNRDGFPIITVEEILGRDQLGGVIKPYTRNGQTLYVIVSPDGKITPVADPTKLPHFKNAIFNFDSIPDSEEFNGLYRRNLTNNRESLMLAVLQDQRDLQQRNARARNPADRQPGLKWCQSFIKRSAPGFRVGVPVPAMVIAAAVPPGTRESVQDYLSETPGIGHLMWLSGQASENFPRTSYVLSIPGEIVYELFVKPTSDFVHGSEAPFDSFGRRGINQPVF